MSKLELIFLPEFVCVLEFLEPSDFRDLSSVSTGILSLLSLLFRNNRYWKQRFEFKIGYVFSTEENPGQTSWLWKYRRISKNLLVHSLYHSSEIFDIKLAYELVGCPDDEESRYVYIRGVVAGSNEQVIRFLASKPEFEMKEYLSDSTGLADLAETSIETLTILLDPELDLDIYVLGIVQELHQYDEEEEDCLEREMFLLGHPAAKISEQTEEYLETAVDQCKPKMLRYLLDREDVEISKKLAKKLYQEKDNGGDYARTVRIFETHPKTRDLLSEETHLNS